MSLKGLENTEKQDYKAKFTFRFHFFLFAIVNALLFVINYMFSPMIMWFVIPMFGWLIAIILHLAAIFSKNMRPVKKGVVIHYATYFSVNLLLFVINYVTFSAISWALYPLIFWGTGLLVHTTVYFEYLSKKSTAKKEGKLKSIIKQRMPLPDKIKALRESKHAFTPQDETIRNDIAEKTLPLKQESNAEKSLTIIKQKRDKIKDSTKIIDLSEEEKKELEKTESEVGVEKKEILCIVHKGPIDGTVYICPGCKSYYCYKCANALKEKGEKCWSCDAELKP